MSQSLNVKSAVVIVLRCGGRTARAPQGRRRSHKVWRVCDENTKPPYSLLDNIEGGVRCFLCDETDSVYKSWHSLRRHLQHRHGMKAQHYRGTYLHDVTSCKRGSPRKGWGDERQMCEANARPPYTSQDDIAAGVLCFICESLGCRRLRLYKDWCLLHQHLQKVHGLGGSHIQGTYLERAVKESKANVKCERKRQREGSSMSGDGQLGTGRPVGQSGIQGEGRAQVADRTNGRVVHCTVPIVKPELEGPLAGASVEAPARQQSQERPISRLGMKNGGGLQLCGDIRIHSACPSVPQPPAGPLQPKHQRRVEGDVKLHVLTCPETQASIGGGGMLRRARWRRSSISAPEHPAPQAAGWPDSLPHADASADGAAGSEFSHGSPTHITLICGPGCVTCKVNCPRAGHAAQAQWTWVATGS